MCENDITDKFKTNKSGIDILEAILYKLYKNIITTIMFVKSMFFFDRKLMVNNTTIKIVNQSYIIFLLVTEKHSVLTSQKDPISNEEL